MTPSRSPLVYWKKIADAGDLKALLAKANLTGDLFLIKPNWFDPRPGSYTDARVLDLVLSALPGKKIIIEGHSHSRNDLSRRITPENMDAERDWIREQEARYLEKLGLKEVMERHGVEYINVTEEFWAGRLADPRLVRDLVLSKYGPLTHTEFYSFVPERLFALRGVTLVDLARIKMTSPTSRDFSLTMKNLFGLLPQPSRLRYHDQLAESINDINKVYRSLFRVFGLAEGIYQAVIFWEGGRFTTPWSRFDVVKDLGIALCGFDLAAVDVAAGRLFGQDLLERAVIKLARRDFGDFDLAALGQPPLLVDLSQPDWPALLLEKGFSLQDEVVD